MKLLRLLSSALLASVMMAGTASAAPALWVMHSGSATVYLFGTVHLLKDLAWRSPQLDAALSKSQDLWLEVPDAFDTAGAAPLITKYGLDPAHPLSTKLTEAERTHLDAVVHREGLGTAAAFESFQPWMAGLVISMTHVIKSGYDPKSGVEKVLTVQMQAAGKPIHGLETIEQQLRFFSSLSPDAQRQMLDEALDDLDAGDDKTDAIVAAWMAGDTDTIAKLVDQDLAASEPDAYRALVVNRNTAWAKQIAQLLQGTSVSFIAVGAGHLAGPDSVQVQLAKRGIKVERE